MGSYHFGLWRQQLIVVDVDPTLRKAVVDVAAELAGLGFADAVEIGRGGFGVVYRCRQVGLGRLVAIKMLTAFSDDDRARFAREQHAAARLTGHPHIVAVLQVGQTPSGCPFLVMPLCVHGCWAERICEAGGLGVDEVVQVGAKIAGALAAAHRAGVVHRDVKPANILLTEYGEPALADFGIAHVRGGFQTIAGFYSGTPAFTAPEVMAGADPGPSADVYGLGATLFVALTGHAAFERRCGEDVVAQFVRFTSGPVPDLSDHAIPAELAAIISAAMAHDPAARPSAGELGEQLRQLQLHQHPGLGPAARPATSPTTALGPTRGNLPLLPGEVVGRGAEGAQLRNLFADSRLVTVTGVGGVGKTTLAIHAASELRAEFPDGVWLVELAELQDGTLLNERVAAELGVRDQPVRPLSDVLMGVLSEQHALLVLDNCEHLIDDVAKFVEMALHRCLRLHVLATSREVLDITGETVLPLSPLAVPDPDTAPGLDGLAGYPGVALFVQRARAAAPDFTLDNRNCCAVARICARLEGLPLAIELAAARIRAMSAEQIAEGLIDRYTLLSRGHRGAPSRHKTLAGCIDWSYQLCTRSEKQLWAAVAVFTGSFDLPAARYLCGEDLGPDGLLLDLLSSLVDKSILIATQQGDRVRFRLLETLRDYAKTHVAQAEQDRLRAREAHWCHQLVTQASTEWYSHAQLFWSTRLMQDIANIRDALQFALGDDPTMALEMAVAMRPVWMFRGMLGEARHWLERVLKATSTQLSLPRIHALGGFATIAFLQGDLSAACSAIAEARHHLEETPDAELGAGIDCIDGYLAVQGGEIDRAAQCFQQALAVATGYEVRTASMYYLGWAFEVSGDLDEAMSCFEAALELTKSQGDSIYQSRVLTSVGMGHWLLGEPQKAEPALTEGLRLAQLVGDPLNGAQSLETLAWIASSRHDWRHAAVMMGAADALSRAIGSPLLYIPDLIACHNVCDNQAREELGAEGFEAAWADGAALNFDEAVVLALDASNNCPDQMVSTTR